MAQWIFYGGRSYLNILPTQGRQDKFPRNSKIAFPLKNPLSRNHPHNNIFATDETQMS